MTYISILRGINVSGHKIIKMAALKEMYEELGFEGVRNYIQSGNVIFQYKKTKPAILEKMISDQVQKQFGFDVPVLVKDLKEFTEAFENNPFLKKRKEDISFLHLTFLSEKPDPKLLDAITKIKYGEDEFNVDGKNVYLFCPGGYGNTKLSNNFFESKLKVKATTRNWKTVTELETMATELK
jgi:uncharacterized protein (DUF1697 family)